ncbi:hypothetical protein AHAS_Ahas13G0121000 [Arachis hypogaea]
MEAIRKTYNICINHVNIEENWKLTDQLKADPQKIVRLAGRATKRRKESVPPPAPADGHKVRRTFQVTCSKCGEKGHYFKTCKGAPKIPNWQPKSRKHKNVCLKIAPVNEDGINNEVVAPNVDPAPVAAPPVQVN